MQDTFQRTMKSFILREGDGGYLLLMYYRIQVLKKLWGNVLNIYDKMN